MKWVQPTLRFRNGATLKRARALISTLVADLGEEEVLPERLTRKEAARFKEPDPPNWMGRGFPRAPSRKASLVLLQQQIDGREGAFHIARLEVLEQRDVTAGVLVGPRPAGHRTGRSVRFEFRELGYELDHDLPVVKEQPAVEAALLVPPSPGPKRWPPRLISHSLLFLSGSKSVIVIRSPGIWDVAGPSTTTVITALATNPLTGNRAEILSVIGFE